MWDVSESYQFASAIILNEMIGVTIAPKSLIAVVTSFSMMK